MGPVEEAARGALGAVAAVVLAIIVVVGRLGVVYEGGESACAKVKCVCRW